MINVSRPTSWQPRLSACQFLFSPNKSSGPPFPHLFCLSKSSVSLSSSLLTITFLSQTIYNIQTFVNLSFSTKGLLHNLAVHISTRTSRSLTANRINNHCTIVTGKGYHRIPVRFHYSQGQLHDSRVCHCQPHTARKIWTPVLIFGIQK